MPELAEVEFYRNQWKIGLRKKILAVEAPPNRVLRGVNLAALRKTLAGATLLDSAAHGKQMLFHFSGGAWVGIHLGMSGELRVDATSALPRKHDRLILRQARQTLSFNDPRQFGRILFHISPDAPPWWKRLPPQILSPEFTVERVAAFLKRRGRAPIKAVLLMQPGFPGIGNWMADEILWQAKIHPRRLAGSLNDSETRRIFARTQSVTRGALRTVGPDWSYPPKNWFYHRRWKPGGHCPRDKAPLRHATIGGRTTCWCPSCQPEKRAVKS